MLTEHRATSHAMNVSTSEVAGAIIFLCRHYHKQCPHLVHYISHYNHLIDDITVPDPLLCIAIYARTTPLSWSST